MFIDKYDRQVCKIQYVCILLIYNAILEYILAN